MVRFSLSFNLKLYSSFLQFLKLLLLFASDYYIIISSGVSETEFHNFYNFMQKYCVYLALFKSQLIFRRLKDE